MNYEFQREDRYIVIKRKDLENVPASYRKDLVDPLPWLQVHLPSRKFLVIESDWPEYEPVWAMIEARISGTHVPPAGVHLEDLTVRNVMAACERASAQHLPETSNWCAALAEYLNNIGRAQVTRLQAENAALQQRLNVADQRVDELSAVLDTCSKWFTKHSPTAPLIGGFGDAEHPMITFIRGALSAPAAKVDCGNCAFVDGVCSTGCETQRIHADQQ